ncbi:hypothetical protein JAAARDRAFT_121761 [Jaapia argillacea MUCL 33604]|uniref:POP1-domain-containing protein n=1 Tax=Jaapia argillacea MUCL 33604 TaxID=933084 RepID=A0A067Q5Q3_9AGAM|nr:hypothetical protein JAAARDRAFT_121761 [Jaapia argillacea MUCL 33604]
MAGLPATIDVEKFAEARAFEINAMQEAMKAVNTAKTTRVWQELPRHLRRRAASHNIRRVPVRLRDKARAEMDPARRKALGRSKPKLGKAKRVSRTETLLKRQKDKTWLETHIWHAKRMHMETKWGYRLAITPTEKSFRPSHRAATHSSILHDASYQSLIQLSGPQDLLKRMLEGCCDPQGVGPGAKRYLTGARVLETHFYEYEKYPFDLIAPITVMAQEAPNLQGKEQDGNPHRTIWIRSHPAVFDQLFATLQTAASATLDAHKKKRGEEPEVSIELADLREHVNVFEIMGPRSSQVIKGVLKVVKEEKREEVKKFLSSLEGLRSAGSVPRGMVVGFTVHDPRLSFPPKNAKVKVDGNNLPSLSQSNITLPSSTLAQSDIWEEDIRNGLKKPRFKKQDIDERKSKNLVPGTPLNPTDKDNRVPILLIQRSLEPSSPILSTSTANPHHGPSDTQGLHGWTLILPAGWSMPFFTSLTHTGTRPAGLRERYTQHFEAGLPFFPKDYVTTTAGRLEEEEKGTEEKEKWERKPKAKRVNFGSEVEVWKGDWERLLGLREVRGEGDVGDNEFVAAQREQEDTTMDVEANVSKLLVPSAGLLAEINRLRAKRDMNPLGVEVSAQDLWKSALVMVRVIPCRRGSPEDLAILYGVDDEERRKWVKVEEVRNGSRMAMDEEGDDEVELSKSIPSSYAIIGRVTSGNFSLARGKGHAIGAIPIVKLFQLQEQAQRLQVTPELFVKVRDRKDTTCRAAFLEVLNM